MTETATRGHIPRIGRPTPVEQTADVFPEGWHHVEGTDEIWLRHDLTWRCHPFPVPVTQPAEPTPRYPHRIDLSRFNPRRMTIAFDMWGMEGEWVDRACGVVEPALDWWEAGHAEPTLEAVGRMATLTMHTVEWFYLHDPPIIDNIHVCTVHDD